MSIDTLDAIRRDGAALALAARQLLALRCVQAAGPDGAALAHALVDMMRDGEHAHGWPLADATGCSTPPEPTDAPAPPPCGAGFSISPSVSPTSRTTATTRTAPPRREPPMPTGRAPRGSPETPRRGVRLPPLHRPRLAARLTSPNRNARAIARRRRASTAGAERRRYQGAPP